MIENPSEKAPPLDARPELPLAETAVDTAPEKVVAHEKDAPVAPPPLEETQPETPEDLPEGVTQAPPPVPYVADGDMEVVAEVLFDENDADAICATDSGTGLGLVWSIKDGTGSYSGATVSPPEHQWLGNCFQFPVAIDAREKLEVSGEFRVAESENSHVIALWAPGDLTMSRACLYYSGGARRKGSYVIQTSWMKMETKLVKGNRGTPAFGDETKVFHKMRMVLDRSKKEISYYVDDIHLGVVSYEGEIPPIPSVGMDIEGPTGGTKLDIRYDNIKVRSFGPMYEYE